MSFFSILTFVLSLTRAAWAGPPALNASVEALGAAGFPVAGATQFVEQAPEVPASQPTAEEAVTVWGNANNGYWSLQVQESTVYGNANDSYVSLTVDRDRGELTGNANGSYISLRWDKDRGIILGNANGSYWNLRLESTGRVVGNANGAYVNLLFSEGRLVGNANGAWVNLSIGEDRITGNANNSYVSLQIDREEGRLIGNANQSYVHLVASGQGSERIFTFTASSVIDALLFGLPLNLFDF